MQIRAPLQIETATTFTSKMCGKGADKYALFRCLLKCIFHLCAALGRAVIDIREFESDKWRI